MKWFFSLEKVGQQRNKYLWESVLILFIAMTQLDIFSSISTNKQLFFIALVFSGSFKFENCHMFIFILRTTLRLLFDIFFCGSVRLRLFNSRQGRGKLGREKQSEFRSHTFNAFDVKETKIYAIISNDSKFDKQKWR